MSAPAGRAELRLGIVGCGRIVERGYIPAAGQAPGIEVTAVADPEPGRAQQVAAACGAAAFASAEEMIAAGGVEALIVATPADRHANVAECAARAGLPALVEKPPAPDLAGAEVLAALDPRPALGFNRRFLQGLELAPRVPAQGWLELDLALSFRRGVWGAHENRDEALLDAGIHLIDLACFLTASPPIAVRSAAVEPERAAFELELGRGRARIRCATDQAYAERVAIRDRSGQLLAATRTSRARAMLGRLRGGEDPMVASLRRQLESFAAWLRGEDATPLATGAAGIAALGVVEAARRSAALEGAEVTVASTAPIPFSEVSR